MSLCMSQTTPTTLVFLLSFSSVSTGIPSSRTSRPGTTCPPCPEDCEEYTSHPGCWGTPPDGCKQGYCREPVRSTAMASRGEHHSMEDLEDSVDSLRVMVAALLALVLILLLAVVLIILKLYLPSVFKCFKRRSGPERRPTVTRARDLRELSVSTIRLANHQQSNESPRPPSRISKQIPHSTPVTEDMRQQSAPPVRRMRQPSESTCPEESSDAHQGYDNLGISTSTLHNQSSVSTSSSNRSLGGVLNSTRTLNTTLPLDHTPHQSLSTRI